MLGTGYDTREFVKMVGGRGDRKRHTEAKARHAQNDFKS